MEATIEERSTGVHVLCDVCGTSITSFTLRKSLVVINKYVAEHYRNAKHPVKKD